MKADFPSASAWRAAAQQLGCEERAIRAVATVEAGGHGAFLDSGEPVILYERHIFHRLTGGRYDGNLADLPGLPTEKCLISAPRWGGYGPLSVQHGKLKRATEFDRPAALQSCSWGLFQVLGLHWQRCGHSSLQRFVNAMYADVDEHLRAFVGFIALDSKMAAALRGRDWATFARRYNGPAYRKNAYDQKMALAYRRAA